jgi:hypothetical protein
VHRLKAAVNSLRSFFVPPPSWSIGKVEVPAWLKLVHVCGTQSMVTKFCTTHGHEVVRGYDSVATPLSTSDSQCERGTLMSTTW